jgi:hypothetical protein
MIPIYRGEGGIPDFPGSELRGEAGKTLQNDVVGKIFAAEIHRG